MSCFPFSHFLISYSGWYSVTFFSGKSYLFGFDMFSELVLYLVVLRTNVPDVCSPDSISLMGAVANVASGAGDLM